MANSPKKLTQPKQVDQAKQKQIADTERMRADFKKSQAQEAAKRAAAQKAAEVKKKQQAAKAAHKITMPNRDNENPTERRITWKGDERARTLVLNYDNNTLSIIKDKKKLNAQRYALQYTIATPRPELRGKDPTRVTGKAIYPDWTPSSGMLGRNPKLSPKTIPGGDAKNPMGKYVVYLDAPYKRIHRAPIQSRIGKQLTNGCDGTSGGDAKLIFGNVDNTYIVKVIDSSRKKPEKTAPKAEPAKLPAKKPAQAQAQFVKKKPA